jgi:hypothetical protein
MRTFTYRLSIGHLRVQRANLIADLERLTLSTASQFALRAAISEYERDIKAHPDATDTERAACV